MNTRTRNRTDRCQQRERPDPYPWVERGPFAHPDELDEPLEGSDTLDGMLDEDWPPEDFLDFMD